MHRTFSKLVVAGALVVLGACMPVRKGPAPGVAQTGEPLWVKATTEKVEYTVKEKVGEAVHKDSSGNVVGSSEVYEDRVETAEYTFWYPMQGDRQIADEDFFRIAGKAELHDRTVEMRTSAAQWRSVGTYLMIGGGAGTLGGWLLGRVDSGLGYAVSLTSVMAFGGGYYGYAYGTRRLAPETHAVDMQEAIHSAGQYNASNDLDAPAVLHVGGGPDVSIGYSGSF